MNYQERYKMDCNGINILSEEAELQLLEGIASGCRTRARDAAMVIHKVYLETITLRMVHCLGGHGAEAAEISFAAMKRLLDGLRSGSIACTEVGPIMSWLWVEACRQGCECRILVWKPSVLPVVSNLIEEFQVEYSMACAAVCESLRRLFVRLRDKPFCVSCLEIWLTETSRTCLTRLRAEAN